MFTFELTDNYILIYNHKTKEIIKEEIPYNIISNNKIYDYLKLNKIIIDIINKYKLLNSLFKTKINILIFENKTPTEIYLLKNLFKNLSNININLIHVSSLFDNKHLFISGNKLYYQDKKVERLNNNFCNLFAISIPSTLMFLLICCPYTPKRWRMVLSHSPSYLKYLGPAMALLV